MTETEILAEQLLQVEAQLRQISQTLRGLINKGEKQPRPKIKDERIAKYLNKLSK